jgi:hypothetical protein
MRTQTRNYCIFISSSTVDYFQNMSNGFAELAGGAGGGGWDGATGAEILNGSSETLVGANWG